MLRAGKVFKGRFNVLHSLFRGNHSLKARFQWQNLVAVCSTWKVKAFQKS